MAVKAYALTTAQRAADFANLGTLSGSKLTKMETFVDVVTDFVEGYLDYRPKKTTYTQEEYSTERGITINLKNFPIVTGETFTLDRRNSGLDFDDWSPVDGQYYHLDEEAGMIEAAGGLNFARTIKGYRVTYTAGYDYDNSSTYLSDTKGGGIELAVWLLLSSVWTRRSSGSDIKSESIGDYKVVFAGAMFENAEVKSLLDKYARQDMPSVITPFQS